MKRLFLGCAAVLLIAASDPATETEHTVKEGETLGGIANRAGVPMGVIAAANGLSEPYNIRIGQKLFIPRQRNHTVKSGETGFGIAMKYGVAWKEIARANGMAPDDTLRSGKTLIIPAVLPEATAARVAARSIAPRDPFFRRPHDGEILFGYRRRPDGGGHEGLDIAVDTGDMIRASASGTVIFAGVEPSRFGNVVVIDHGGGWHTAYGHLGSTTVKRGETVKAGERIGIGGQSGVATRPELHFEIRKDRKPIDPATKLADRD